MPEYQGFPEYEPRDLPKVNALRAAKTRPDFYGVPILSEGDVGFVTAESRHGEPNSCYNCQLMNGATKTCAILGSRISVSKYIKDDIEFWPVCGLHRWARPYRGERYFPPFDDPDHVGLIWANAPEVGLKLGGVTCGGTASAAGCGSDDCDHFMVKGTDDKRSVPEALCRVLQKNVAGGACCGAWTDDDLVDWREAQAYLGTMVPLPPEK